MGLVTRPSIDARTARRSAPHRRFFPIPSRPDPSDSPRGWLYPGEPEACRRDLRKFLPILGQMAVLLAVIGVYRVEGRALLLLGLITLIALPIHYALPFRHKKAFFLAASLIGLGAVFGPGPALAVIGLALPLIAATRLPIAWSARVALISAAALGLAIGRAYAASSSLALAEIVWPVAGSMLMFRMIIYLYELKHAKKPEPWVDTLNYFFLLPNFAFLHFPVVDYRTMGRSFFARDVHETQLAGLRMIFNGVAHLLAYRLIYHRLLISADEVNSPATLLAYIACNYLLYLRVSGQFHVACGMLHLFGYQLPQTHHNYLLASGFTDYWRRVNIYWKDFMIRVVFNPVAFRLKRRPRWVALATATSAVFATTWFLHAYQTFWLRGSWGFSAPDALFWGILGGLVLINVQLDARASDARPTSRTDAGSPRAIALRAAKTAATFATIATLWSLWSSPSLGAWAGMFGKAFRP
ncbi:hypothetical protein TA3x_004997 [Tundrisphaera sp. TA3]|uniref:hypothetical protein n=1 Tax=Tundrisphaera sp. TA3 TaxID=3435775 RepID=UPI003EC1187A